MSTATSEYDIRWMIRRDMVSVLDIEERCFENAWTGDSFIRCLRQRTCIGMVAKLGDKVVGFMIYELHRKAYFVINFAVHPEFQRKGVGKAMVDKLFSKLSESRRSRILLEVREVNLNAQLFFKSQGFIAVGIVKDSFDDTDEDAYLMQRRFNDEKGAWLWER